MNKKTTRISTWEMAALEKALFNAIEDGTINKEDGGKQLLAKLNSLKVTGHYEIACDEHADDIEE